MEEQWICYSVKNRKITRWGITTQRGRRGLEDRWMAEGENFNDANLSYEPQDAWLRNEPLTLAERVLYMISEYDWPPSAIRALADAVYAITRAERR